MAWGSTIPTALAALTVILDAAIDGVSVDNGAELGSGSGRDSIAVGYQSEDDPTAVIGRFEKADYGAVPDQERYGINCRIAATRGGTDILRVQARVFQLLASVGKVIGEHPTLDGVVMSASLGSYTLTQSQGKRGSTAVLLFSVDVNAFTTT